jgi:DNA invertase Pin-like site-specific DNA recombinase
MNYRLGYARVSTHAQDPQLQLDALTAAGVDRIYIDHISGVATRRPDLDRLLDSARPGDAIVIWRQRHRPTRSRNGRSSSNGQQQLGLT